MSQSETPVVDDRTDLFGSNPFLNKSTSDPPSNC